MRRKLTLHDDTHGHHQAPKDGHWVRADGLAQGEVVSGIARGLGALLDDAGRLAGGALDLRRLGELFAADLGHGHGGWAVNGFDGRENALVRSRLGEWSRVRAVLASL